jgi:hypothetical protein
MSLGSFWQSVERHHVSEPLVTVNVCVLVPTFTVHAFVLWLTSLMLNCGFTPAAYAVLSVTAVTTRSVGAHDCGAVDVGDGFGDEDAGDVVGVDPGVGVTDVTAGVGVCGAVRVVDTVWRADALGVAAAPRQGCAMTSHTTTTTTRTPSNRTSRRRRYTAGDCRRRGALFTFSG